MDVGTGRRLWECKWKVFVDRKRSAKSHTDVEGVEIWDGGKLGRIAGCRRFVEV
jgi:hypothetical protein